MCLSAQCELWMALRIAISIAVGLIAFLSGTTRAQGPPPRDYLNTPVNQVRFFGDFLASNAQTAASSDIPLPNNVTISRNLFVSLLWSFPLAGRYGGVGASAGYARVKVNGPLGSVQTWGFTDPSITFHANFFGSPALGLAEYPTAVPKTFSSFHLTVNTPLGSYDSNSAVNTGANRWAFTPVVNLSITPDKGVSWIDLYAGGRFVTNNNAFQGTKLLTQSPLGVFSTHYSHKIGKRMWAGIGLHYDNGGESFVNHIPQHDYANGFRPALIVGRRVGKFSVSFRYENTASRPNAAPTNGLLSLRFAGPLYPF